MCGIVGSLSRGAGVALELSRLHHRGPDAQGSVSFALPWARGHLGATRLSIVDAQTPHAMPAVYPYLGVALAFNGEIYNWRALRAELSDGTPWQTECDTEVVARAWRKWGEVALDRLNGMFALAIADLHDGEVLLARDRAGEKPLYYAIDRGALHFASEIKALGIELVEGPCTELATLEFDCLATTPFRGVRRLGPGELLRLREVRNLYDPMPRAWWTLPDAGDGTRVVDSCAVEQAAEELTPILADAIRLRWPENVSATVLVSGGLDSAIVQAVVRAPCVYCCTFSDIDCEPFARLAAPGAEVVPVTFDLADAHAALPGVAYHLDTPATWSALALWFLNKRLAADGYRVVISGEGADELFGGYARYRVLWWIEQMRADPLLAGYGPIQAATLATSDTGGDNLLLARMLDRGDLAHARRLVARFGGAGDLPSRMARTDWHTTMQVLLRMADTMAAAHSVENRSPFFDPRVIAFATRLPLRAKIDATRSKAVLREVAARLGVAREIIDDQHKRGLVVPWNRWRGVGSGARGAWDRGDFAVQMRAAWRSAFKLDTDAAP